MADTPSSESTPDPSSTRGLMAIQQHIQNHMRLGSIPPLHEWTSVDLPPIELRLLAHIRGAVGQNNLQVSTIRFWYRGTAWFAVVGVVLQENIVSDWTALDGDIERIIKGCESDMLAYYARPDNVPSRK